MSFAYAMMTANTTPDDFFPIVVDNLSRELKMAAYIDTKDSEFEVHFGCYSIHLNREVCAITQFKGAYALDELVLSSLLKAGLKVEKRKSPYIQRCLPEREGLCFRQKKLPLDPVLQDLQRRVQAEKLTRYRESRSLRG